MTKRLKKAKYLSVLSDDEQLKHDSYYCHDCKQLRIGLVGLKSVSCMNCNSTNIVVDRVGSKALLDLRFKKEGAST